MIVDSLNNYKTYLGIHPRFTKAFEYLRNADLVNLPEGRNEIDGDEIFLMMNRSELKKQEDAPIEVHSRYIDIQIVIEGTETFGWKNRSELTQPQEEFNMEKDIQFFDDDPVIFYTIHDRQMSIFFPGDGHAPMIGEGNIVKCVVKVLI